MPVSPHFNNYSSGTSPQQLLLDDLINEIIHIAGADCYYIMRDTEDEIDLVFGEDPTSKFSRSYLMEMYVNNVEGWANGGDFFSKFGLQINKETNVIVGRRTFRKYTDENIIIRPREGDLVYIPVMQKLFEIKFVDKEKRFYTHGAREPYYYELQLEMFKYSQENIDTGIDEIDLIEREHSYVIALDLTTGTGNFNKDEYIYEGTDILTNNATAQVHSWDVANTQILIYNIKGEFNPGSNVVGVTSNAQWTIETYDDQEDHEDYRFYQNDILETESNTTFSKTEVNPFGDPFRDN